MKRVCIIHHSLNPCGGGELVALATMELLKELGYYTVLITTEPTDWKRVEKLTGHRIRPDEEKTTIPFKLGKFGVYQRLLSTIGYMLYKGKCDLSINTHGDILPIPTDIIYIHFPTFLFLTDEYMFEKYSSSLFWKTYYIPYMSMEKFLVQRALSRLRSTAVLTNSSYSAKAIRKYIGVEPLVVYPPVDIDKFLLGALCGSREDIIVSCGRYSMEKRYHFILDIAKHLPEYRFYIIGSISSPSSRDYYNRVRAMKEKHGLDNVELLVDYPRTKQIMLYSHAKAYMHAMIGEHFGISIVEAMASGLVPVVHKSGGAWMDIVDYGRYGYGYSSLDEAVEAVEKAVKNYWSLREKMVNRAKQFTKEVFMEKMKKIIEVMMK